MTKEEAEEAGTALDFLKVSHSGLSGFIHEPSALASEGWGSKCLSPHLAFNVVAQRARSVTWWLSVLLSGGAGDSVISHMGSYSVQGKTGPSTTCCCWASVWL